MGKAKSFWDGFVRLVKFKILVPILRSNQPPSYTARGSLVGLIWAMTPLIGVQMYLVFMTWLIAKKFFKWDFNLPIALAWTWVTNVFTLAPTYYLFFVTGKILMGQFQQIGYEAFNSFISPFKEDVSIWEAFILFFKLFLKDWGIAMMLGCVPWAIFCGWLGYYSTLKWINTRDARRSKIAALRNMHPILHLKENHQEKKELRQQQRELREEKAKTSEQKQSDSG